MTEFTAEPVPMDVDKNSEKIDMSLDEIIELNKKENISATIAVNRTREQQKRQWNLYPRIPQIQPGQRMQQNIQGSSRPQGNASGSQGYGRINQRWQTQARYPRIRPDGRKPTIAAKQQIAPIWKGTPRIIWGRAQQIKRSFRPIRQGAPQLLKRSFRIMFQNKVSNQQKRQLMQNQQRQTKVNIKRGFLQMGLETAQKKQWTRVWQQRSSTSSILTISVPNPLANHPPVQRSSIQQSIAGRKRMATKGVRKQPKGVYLGFNLKSIVNQTYVTLNDRFSSIKIRPHPATPRRGGRTVTMG
ncbi:UAP56-interacting factor-like [Rhinoraja longicauda]